MALNKKPVTGMREILPAEMQIRDYVIGRIKETYKGFGFTPIETPCVESIANLCSKQGGENEKLIFKIMKRGEKLNWKEAENENDLADSGLRYDLTLPLSRFYSNHAANLPKPFKALQIGPVWRAERPQKGRYRQFYQCDIDILGDPTNMAEIELIQATTTLLGELGFSGFTVRINDRRILKAMAQYSQFPEARFEEVFVILDKLDKIGTSGVIRELKEAGFADLAIERCLQMFEEFNQSEDGIAYMGEKLSGFLEEGTTENLQQIAECVTQTAQTDFQLVFDPTLVRGMSYYTGTIFEIGMEGFGGSVAGGGRYDEMIGKFTGVQTCACGFSIGFERIVTILMDQQFRIPSQAAKKAYLIEKGMCSERLCEVMREAQNERSQGTQVLVTWMNKNKKFQKKQLEEEGYTEWKEFYINPLRQ